MTQRLQFFDQLIREDGGKNNDIAGASSNLATCVRSPGQIRPNKSVAVVLLLLLIA